MIQIGNLIDATRWNYPFSSLSWQPVTIPHVWDICYVRENVYQRALADILIDVAQHAITHPSHGIDCFCMDTFIREMRIHARKAIPRTEDHDSVDPVRFEMHARVRYVLGAVARSI